MKKVSANKRKALNKKGWKVTNVTELLNLTPNEEAQIELKLLVLDKFPDATIIESTDKRIEFLLTTADENLQSHLTKIFNLGNCVFSLAEKNKDRQIRVVLSR